MALSILGISSRLFVVCLTYGEILASHVPKINAKGDKIQRGHNYKLLHLSVSGLLLTKKIFLFICKRGHVRGHQFTELA